MGKINHMDRIERRKQSQRNKATQNILYILWDTMYIWGVLYHKQVSMAVTSNHKICEM